MNKPSTTLNPMQFSTILLLNEEKKVSNLNLLTNEKKITQYRSPIKDSVKVISVISLLKINQKTM